MPALVDLLWFPVFSIFGAGVTVIEILGFASGAVCVWLVGRQNPWNWPIGLIQVVAYLFLFWQVGLFADSALQAAYLVLGLWGWWNWLRRQPDAGVLRVRQASWSEFAVLLVLGGAAAIGLWWVLVSFTASTVPWADAVTTALSLLATYAQARKILQSWWLWIFADSIYIPMYAVKGLWLTALLYSMFIVLCIVGVRRWKRAMADNNLTRAS